MTLKQKRYILTIDDDEDFNALLKAKLKNCKIPVITTTNLADFSKYLGKALPLLCLIDINIDEHEELGLKIIQSIRKKYGHDLPLLVISTINEAERITSALEIGATDFIVKPFDPLILEKKIDFFLELENVPKESYKKIKEGPTAVSINQFINVREITEFGLKVETNIFMARGSIVTLSEGVLEKIGVKGTHPAVIENVKMLKEDLYETLLEFDADEKEVLSKIKTWLNKQHT
jgi:DNA-binding response OmpR family regulator